MAPKDFFKPLLVYRPDVSDWLDPANYGYCHVPKGYLDWLQGITHPPLGGSGPLKVEAVGNIKYVPGSNSLYIPRYIYPEPRPQGVLSQLEGSGPADDDIDDDGLPNAWEAYFQLQYRDPSNADIIIPIPDDASSEEKAAIEARLAKLKSSRGLILPQSKVHNPDSGITLEDWKWSQRVDPDRDGLGNLLEFKLGTNPKLFTGITSLDNDADKDGFSDREEIFTGSDPNLASSQPPSMLTLVSGASQVAKPGDHLEYPIIVTARQFARQSGISVSFHTDNGGYFTSLGGSEPQASITVLSDAEGLAAVRFVTPATVGRYVINASTPHGDSIKIQYETLSVMPPGGTGGSGPTLPPEAPELGSAKRPYPPSASIKCSHTSRYGSATGFGHDELYPEDPDNIKKYANKIQTYRRLYSYSNSDNGGAPGEWSEKKVPYNTQTKIDSFYNETLSSNSSTISQISVRYKYPALSGRQYTILSDAAENSGEQNWLFSGWSSYSQTSLESTTEDSSILTHTRSDKGGTQRYYASDAFLFVSSSMSRSGDYFSELPEPESDRTRFEQSSSYDSERDPFVITYPTSGLHIGGPGYTSVVTPVETATESGFRSELFATETDGTEIRVGSEEDITSLSGLVSLSSVEGDSKCDQHNASGRSNIGGLYRRGIRL